MEAAPLLGRHTAQVLASELEMTETEVAELRASGAIGSEGAGERAAK